MKELKHHWEIGECDVLWQSTTTPVFEWHISDMLSDPATLNKGVREWQEKETDERDFSF